MTARSVGDLAAYLGGEVSGDPSIGITGLAGLDDAKEGDLTFLANPRYAGKVATTRASAVVIAPGGELYGRTGIVVADPYLAFAKLLTLFTSRPRVSKGIMPGAYVSPTARIGTEPSIYPGVYVGEGVTVGDRVTLHPNVVIGDGVTIGDDVTLHAGVSVRGGCRIGNRVTVHDNTTIGSDGFGYAPDGDGHYKIPQVGIVIVEDDVEIGANCAIDRAALKATRIGRGTKIDNLVQIAHNCEIGENCIIVSQVGISGSTRLGRNVTLGGQVGVAGHLTIADGTTIAAKSGVMGDVEKGVYGGIPIRPHREWLRSAALVERLPEMRKKIAELERAVAVLAGRTE